MREVCWGVEPWWWWAGTAGLWVLMIGTCCKKRSKARRKGGDLGWTGSPPGPAKGRAKTQPEPGTARTQAASQSGSRSASVAKSRLASSTEPPPDGSVELELGGSEGSPSSAPRRVHFSTIGHVKTVPRDQGDQGAPWTADESRASDSAAGRAHVLRTLNQIGGYLINEHPSGGPVPDALDLTWHYAPPGSVHAARPLATGASLSPLHGPVPDH